MKNIIYRLGILFFAIASVACEKDPPEVPETFDFKIVDGMIQSPKWLADKVEEVADRYGLTPSGEKHYPWVYKDKYEGREYIWIWDGLSATVVGGYLFFTLSGDSVAGGSDLWKELYETVGKGDRDDLLWRYEYRSAKGKSIATRADQQFSFYTPNGTPVPGTWIRDEWYTTPARILQGQNYYKSAYPNATELSGPSTTYNCHGYVWSITERGYAVWIGYNSPGQTNVFVDDGSYEVTSSSTPGAKVRYLNADHSAIAETSDIFVSKWDEHPLYRHHKNYSPFGSSPQLAYYKRATPVISGPETVSLNTNATYFVSAPPAGTFNGWTVSPGSGYTVTGGTSSRTLVINFNAPGTYTLTANFTMHNNQSYSVAKTINVKYLTAPVVTPLRTTNIYDGNVITFFVQNHQAGILYEWQVVEGGTPYGPGPMNGTTFMALPRGHLTLPTPFTVRCRATLNGQYSSWTWVYLTIEPGPPGPIRVDSAEPDEDQES